MGGGVGRRRRNVGMRCVLEERAPAASLWAHTGYVVLGVRRLVPWRAEACEGGASP